MFTAKEISDYVDQNKQEIIECLVELLQTPSVTGDEVAVSAVFEKWLKKIGILPRIVGISPDHPNVLAEWFGSKQGKRFLFNGHMDHFPPSVDMDNLWDPYSGMVDGGYIYGCGACDMKGGDAAVIMATILLKRMGFDPQGSIFLSFTCDEQIGGRYGIKWLVEQGFMEGDFGIIPEPTSKRIMIGHSGILRMYFTYTAESAHSGRHHPKMDAIEKSVLAINELYKYREVIKKRLDPDYDSASICITTLRAGTATNVHATESIFSIDRRLVTGEKHEEVKKEIFACLDRLKERYPEIDMNYTWEIISDRPFLDVPSDSPIVKAAAAAYEEITGKSAVLFKRHGGSDGATIQAHNGIHLPNWGAAALSGEGEFFAAQPKERISVADYLESVKYYMLTVVKLMGDKN